LESVLEIYSRNPAHSWKKWKIRSEIYLQAMGTLTKPDAQKVGLTHHHISE